MRASILRSPSFFRVSPMKSARPAVAAPRPGEINRGPTGTGAHQPPISGGGQGVGELGQGIKALFLFSLAPPRSARAKLRMATGRHRIGRRCGPPRPLPRCQQYRERLSAFVTSAASVARRGNRPFTAQITNGGNANTCVNSQRRHRCPLTAGSRLARLPCSTPTLSSVQARLEIWNQFVAFASRRRSAS